MLITAFLFGLFGSLHCVGMCGPIAFMLPIDRINNFKGSIQLGIYHAGRIFSYSLIGAVFGLLGKSFTLFGLQQQISIVVGVLMIVSIILPKLFKKIKFEGVIYSFTNRIKSKLGESLKKRENPTFFTLGFLNGLLPCGLVYMAVLGTLASTNILEGIVYMSLFGLGTVPLMTTVAMLGNVSKFFNWQKLQKIIPIVVVVIGILFVLRGLGLGIPYVSPKPMVDLVDTTQSCH